MTARETALKVLIICRTEDAWLDAVLLKEIADARLSRKDAALCTNLCSGVLQNRILIDYYIDMFLQGRKHLKPVLRDILRLAVYQIVFLDRIPDSAAVNEAVKETKKRFGTQDAGVCNGILRNMLRSREKLVPPQDYSVRYSHPDELVTLLKKSVGKKLGAILEADNMSPETSVCVNTLKTDAESLEQQLLDADVEFVPHPWLKNGYLLRRTGNLESLPAFQNGLFQIQDAAARLSINILNPQPGMRVLDLCAAPGGKSIAAAQLMHNTGSIVSCDVHAGKLPQIEKAAQRLGVSIIETMENDASAYNPAFEEKFDCVIADVPCSGLGVIRKKPDIRYKSIESIAGIPTLQSEILAQAGKYVKPGGLLLYTTCTILKQENEEQAEAFLERHPEFTLEPFENPEGLDKETNGMMTLYQGIDHCDGFFICLMRKKL